MKNAILTTLKSAPKLPLAALVSAAMLTLPSMAQAQLNKVYELSENGSQIIKFSQPLKRAMIANPDLATVKVLNNKELLVTGTEAGRTQLIITYRNSPNEDHQAILDVAPDQSKKEEIEATLTQLLKDLNPQNQVRFELKSIWINPESSVRREVDAIGNQIDGDSQTKIDKRKDTKVLQAESKSGQLDTQPLAGNYMVLLSGEVPNKAQKKRIQSVISALGLSVVNMIKVTGPQQIKLSVRVAEVVKGNPFRSGVAIRDKQDRFGLFPPGNLGTTASFLLNVQNVAPGTPAAMSFPHPDGFQLGLNPSGYDLFGVLSVLEGNNLARVLAKPELIVQSGETAEFLVGGEVPIPVAQDENTITIEYKEFGVRLSFSPIITESGKIQMTVAPEVSNIDASAGYQAGNIVVPGFRSRKTATTITMEAGQSFVIGGLIQDNIRSQISEVPYLSKIPLLGALFRSTSYEKDQSELAILVTPQFVEPIAANTQVALPGENLDRPSNLDGFFSGKLAKILPQGQSALAESAVKIGLETP